MTDPIVPVIDRLRSIVRDTVITAYEAASIVKWHEAHRNKAAVERAQLTDQVRRLLAQLQEIDRSMKSWHDRERQLIDQAQSLEMQLAASRKAAGAMAVQGATMLARVWTLWVNAASPDEWIEVMAEVERLLSVTPPIRDRTPARRAKRE